MSDVQSCAYQHEYCHSLLLDDRALYSFPYRIIFSPSLHPHVTKRSRRQARMTAFRVAPKVAFKVGVWAAGIGSSQAKVLEHWGKRLLAGGKLAHMAREATQQ